MIIKNNNDLKKFIGTTGGNAAIMGMNDSQIQKIMSDACYELQGYMKDELETYFRETPKSPIYERTGDSVRAIKVIDPYRNASGNWEAGVSLNSFHDSLIGGEQGNALSLMNTGWQTEGYTVFGGLNYVKKAVDKFNGKNKYNIEVKILSNGMDISQVTFSYGKQMNH